MLKNLIIAKLLFLLNVAIGSLISVQCIRIGKREDLEKDSVKSKLRLILHW